MLAKLRLHDIVLENDQCTFIFCVGLAIVTLSARLRYVELLRVGPILATVFEVIPRFEDDRMIRSNWPLSLDTM
jgi:hypothetical protein